MEDLHVMSEEKRHRIFEGLRVYEKNAEEVHRKTPLEKKLDRLEDKIDTIEDVLEIKPGFPESVEITKQELDLTPFEDKIKDNEDKDIEEEE